MGGSVCIDHVVITSSISNSNAIQKKLWRKTLAWIVGLVILVLCAFYAYFFIRVAPPRFVQVVDAISGRPLANMNVCMQLVADGWGNKQALRSELSTTDAKGKVFFWPSINNLSLFDEWVGYSIQVSDPKSSFAPPCGSQVGLDYSQLADHLGSMSSDGSEYFPVELVEQVVPTQPQTWTLIRRVGSSGMNLKVELIPIVRDISKCGELDSQVSRDCSQLAVRTESAVTQKLVPMYFAGMERTILQSLDKNLRSSGLPGYMAIYSRGGVPSESMSVLIKEFPDTPSAVQGSGDFLRVILGYTPNTTTEEIIPGQKIQWIGNSTSYRAFWISQKYLVLIGFSGTSAASGQDQQLVIEWLRLHPSSMGV